MKVLLGLLLLSVVVIAGCSAVQDVVDVTSTTADTTSTVEATTTSTVAIETCPDKFKRTITDADGNMETYCPSKAVFGCTGMTWDECSRQELDDDF